MQQVTIEALTAKLNNIEKYMQRLQDQNIEPAITRSVLNIIKEK